MIGATATVDSPHRDILPRPRTPATPPPPRLQPPPPSSRRFPPYLPTALSLAGPCNRWRCAPWLEQGDDAPPSARVTEIWPKGLTSGAATAAALRRGGPVLLRGTKLSGCYLAPPPPAAAAAARPAKADAGAAEEETLPSRWQQQPKQPGPQGASSVGGGAAPRAPPAAVLSSPARSGRFMRCDASKNAPGSCYELRRPERGGLELPGMGVEEWRRCWLSWAAHKLLLSVKVCTWELEAAERSAGASARVHPNSRVWDEVAALLQCPAADGSQVEGPDDAGRRLAEGILDWQQLELLVEVRAGVRLPVFSLLLE